MTIPGSFKRLLLPLKKALQYSFEAFWSWAFRLLGRIRKPRAEIWDSEGGQRILVIATHPDDEVAGCAGVILRHRRAGDRVVVAFVTDGRASTAYGMTPEAMAATRRSEARQAIRLLGVEECWFGLRERQWDREQLKKALAKLLDDLSPHLVYAPSRVDFHPDHERVARLIASSLGDPTVRVFPVQVPLTPTLCNLIAPITAPNAVEEVLFSYESQIGTLERCLRHRRLVGCLYRRRGLVEEFWQMSADQYRRLHRERPSTSLTRVFRGIRYYAWSDPLAYLIAQRERRQLARAIREQDV